MLALSTVKMLALLCCGLAAASVSAQTNPFEAVSFYVNPSYQKELDSSIATATGDVKSTLQSMRSVPSAYWLDVKAKITGNGTDSAEGILADAMSQTPVPLVTLIVYDLPNRDCKAKASNGEICCTKNTDGTCDYNAAGDCADGISEYKNDYIDPLVAVLKKYDGKVPIALVIEPDSLPNLATNLADPHCGNSATQAAYNQGVPYAINAIATATSHVTMYLDAAHGGWLGWEDNLEKFVQLIAKLDITDKLRGFSTNVANYQPIGQLCPGFTAENYAAFRNGTIQARNDYCLNGAHQSDPCCSDPCRLEGQYNPANNERNFVAALNTAMSAGISGFSPHFIIDTGRNGVADMRKDCANWCNPRGAGVGQVPTTETNSDIIDAFFWLKTPGESDGCTQTLPSGLQCARYDSMCGSNDSIGSQSSEPRVPEAGKWFDYGIKQLAANAHMGPAPAPGPPTPTPAPPAPPAPTPTPPTPAPPAPAPSGDCPGGSLKACVGLCPTDPSAVYKACVNNCIAKCAGGTPTPAPPVPTPPVPTPAPPTPAPPAPAPSGDCPGGSLKACVGLCPTDPAAVYKACVNNCIAKCAGGTPTPAPLAPTPAPPAPTPIPPVPPPTTPTPAPSGQCAPVYQQCGGDPTQGYHGPTCCDTGCVCHEQSQYYSQCLPPSPDMHSCT